LPEDGKAYFKAALGKGLEGIMAKRLASPYQPRVRSRDWIKIKKCLTLDLVAGGVTFRSMVNGKPFFGGLLLGAYDSGKLIFTGKVGSGFSMQELKEIFSEFVPSEEFAVLPPFFYSRCLMAETRIDNRGRGFGGIQEETSQGTCVPPKKN
jgi:bifunctional non-homologous end joining protein LigD